MKKLRLPTYEDAQKIVQEKGELVFYETIRYINNCKISTFNYRLTQYSDFIHDEIDFREMRGLTFVFNEDGSLFKRFLLMKKFWNINQVPETMYSEIKDYELVSCYNKVDGSLISFIDANGKVVTKTKMGFDNEQTKVAEEIFNTNSAVNDMVTYCLDNDIISMWEFVSFKNRIVLNYDKPNLILLRLRDNKTGDYLDIEKYRGKGFDVAEQEDYTVDDFIELAETLEDKEGCVFTLKKPDGEEIMVKRKTEWYFERHNLLTNEINREDYIIHSFLNETIDDIKSQLDEEKDIENIKFIEMIEEITSNFLVERIAEVDLLVSKFYDKKSFALTYRKDKNFGLAMSVINRNIDSFIVVKEWLLNHTRKLEQARSFVKRKGFKRK